MLRRPSERLNLPLKLSMVASSTISRCMSTFFWIDSAAPSHEIIVEIPLRSPVLRLQTRHLLMISPPPCSLVAPTAPGRRRRGNPLIESRVTCDCLPSTAHRLTALAKHPRNLEEYRHFPAASRLSEGPRPNSLPYPPILLRSLGSSILSPQPQGTSELVQAENP